MMRLKANDRNDASEAILVSFNSKWSNSFFKGVVSQVFRKRGPKIKPKWVYVYVGSPTKAIIGRLPVTQLRQLSLTESLSLAKGGDITIRELSEYAAGYESLFVYTVGNFEPSKQPIEFSYLRDSYGFTPPQNFLIISQDGKKELDRQCGFPEQIHEEH